jgi:MFS family permease
MPGSASDPVRRLTASIVVSSLGTWTYNVGIAVYAYESTHSPAWVAAATAGRYVPALGITWLGGRVVDNRPRRWVAVTADLVCALVMVALTVAVLVGAPLWFAIALARCRRASRACSRRRPSA